MPPYFVVNRGKLHFAQRTSGESGVGDGTLIPLGSVFDLGVGVVFENASEARERRPPPPIVCDLIVGVTSYLLLLYT